MKEQNKEIYKYQSKHKTLNIIDNTNIKAENRIYRTNSLVMESIYELNFDKNEKIENNKKISKSVKIVEKFKNIKNKFFPPYNKILIDNDLFNLKYITDFSNSNNIKITNKNEKSKINGPIKLTQRDICEEDELELKQVNKDIKYNNEEKEKYFTPTKSEKNILEKIYKEKGKIIKIIRKEKNKKDKKPKHLHQAKKDKSEEIHMSDFKPQNKENQENQDKQLIEGEEEEIKHITVEEEKNEDTNILSKNDNKESGKNESEGNKYENEDEKEDNDKNKDNNEDNNNIVKKEDESIKKNEAIDAFLKDLDNNNIINKDKNKIKEEESEDPFEKVENEYRIQKNECKENENKFEDEDDIIKDIDLDINENEEEIKVKENSKEEIEKEKIKEEEKEEKEIKESNDVEKVNENELKEIKDNKKDDEKNQIKENEKTYYKTYLNYINKKNKKVNLLFNKDQGNIYLKEVYNYQNYRNKMKKYNRKTGAFDLFINKNDINKILSKEDIYYNDSSKENINNNTIENFRKYPKNFPKIKDNNFYINTFSNKYLTNTINTDRININKKRHFLKKNYSHKNERRINTEININLKKKNNIQDMIHFILDGDNDKINRKLNPINKRRNSEQNKIIDTIFDPNNPYSTIWPNKFLNINYNMGIHFNETEQGVPHLSIKKLKKKNLPPLSYRNILKIDENICYDKISSRLKKNLNNQSYKINNNIKDKIINENLKSKNDVNKSKFNFVKNQSIKSLNYIENNSNNTEVINEEIE